MNLQGKTLLVIGGGLLQQPCVHIAHEMGLRVACTDRNPQCVCATLADEFYPIDIKDVAAHIQLAKRIPNLAGVIAEGISAEVTCAEAASAAGLPGIPPDVARRIANKAELRETLTKAGFLQPRFECVNVYRHALIAAERIGYPVVVKATDNSGSRGLTKCYSQEELTHDVYLRARYASSDGRVLIEELLTPIQGEIAEQSCESVWYQGEAYFLNWVDRPFKEQGRYAIELGHFNPAEHSPLTTTAVENMVLDAGRACGMSTGIFKCDTLLTERGPVILEATARLSGGFDSAYTSPLAHGVDYIKGAIKLALGEPIDWECFTPKWHNHAVAWAMFPEPGRIKAIRGLDDARLIADYVFCRFQAGDVIPPYSDCATRPIFIIASGATRAKALDKAQAAEKHITVETEAT